jgi:hypothetical protein
MQFPDVEIKPGESIQDATERVTQAYGAEGSILTENESLTALFPSSSCRFLESSLEKRQLIVVVVTSPWDERSVLAVLNILLSLRSDPDPPGPPPLFRFYSAHQVPPVLLVLFGDSPPSDFECRAAVVAHFGSDLQPSQSFQLAAVSMYLLRESLGIKTGFFDPAGDHIIGRVIVERFRGVPFSEGAAPINAVIVLGFLYGEILRARSPFRSRWIRLKEYAPWPALAFGPPEVGDAGRQGAPGDPGKQGGRRGEEPQGVPQVVFSPIHSVIGVYQGGTESLLAEARQALEEKCAKELGKSG